MSGDEARVIYWKNNGRLIAVANQNCVSAEEATAILNPFLRGSQPYITDSLDELNPKADLIYMAQSANWHELGGTSLAPPVNRLEVNLSKLGQNIERFADRMKTPVVAMVKANAYGHGMIEVANFAETLPQVTHLGVATTQEGVSLRAAGINKEILVTYPTVSDVPLMFKHELTLAVGDLQLLRALAETTLPISIHIDVDTGFHRSGFAHDELPIAKELIEDSNLQLVGMMTHLSCADEHGQDKLNQSQVQRFSKASDLFEGEILRHIGNTAASLLWNNNGWSPARPGIAIYGLHPSDLTENEVLLEPIAQLRSEVIQCIDVPPGEFVGYGATWTAPDAGARVALIPSGYGDGISRQLSSSLPVSIAGQMAKVIGRISMDSFVVDISHLPEVEVGDPVIVYSDAPGSPNSVDAIAGLTSTINYEVTTRLTQRLCRTYSF